MASNEWLVRKLHEQDKKIEALSRGGTGVGHSSIAPGENLTVISDNGEVVLGAGGVEHVDGPTPATPSAPTLKLGFGTIEVTWDGSFAEGEDEDGVPLTAPVDFDVVEVHCSTDPEEEEWGEDTMRGQIKTREGGTITVGGFDVDDEVFVCLIALAKTGKRSAPSATASLVIEGLDFSQLFNEIDAANATIRNAGEVLVTEQGTLDEKLTEVDGTLNDLGQDLAAVEDAQAQLNTDLSDVITSVDGKNTITWNPSAPSKVSNPGKAVGDMWYRTSGNSIIGFWKWDGTDWVTQLLDKTTIPLIDIGAGTFGTLNGVRLEAGSVAASSIAVGDFTNLATIDPVRDINVTRPSSWATETVGDFIRTKPSSQDVLMFKDRTDTVPFNAGDALRIKFRVKADAETEVQFRLWAYPQDSNGASSGQRQLTTPYMVLPPWTTDQEVVLPIPEDFGVGVTYRSWIIGLAPHPSRGTTRVLGVKDVSIYRMTGQTLIQDGAVSTAKLSADVLEVKNLKATSGQLDEAVINKLFSDVVVAKTAVAEAFIGENAILTGAVTATKITASEELWAKIAQFVQIRAEHIESDAIDGMVITGATIRSAATGARTLMSASGFEAYNTANERTFFADASTGEVSITGKLFTGKSGFSRVSLDPTLWSSLPVYDEDGTVAGYANGAGVRVGIGASDCLDMYHAGLSGSVHSGVIQGPGGTSKVVLTDRTVQLYGENSPSTMHAVFGGKFRTRSQNKTDSNQYSIIDQSYPGVNIRAYDALGDSAVSAIQGAARISCTDEGKYSSVSAAAGSVELRTYYGGFDTSWIRMAGSDTFGSTYVDVSAEHINPLRVNYAGTGDSWLVPFRKSGTTWGYIGSSAAMGVNDFGMQSAAGKDLSLVAVGSSNVNINVDNAAGGRFRVPSVYNVTASGSANVVVNSQGTLFRPSSSKRYKRDIEDFTPKPDILDIRTTTWRDIRAVEESERAHDYLAKIGQGPLPVEFQDAELEPTRHFGAIAEEVHEMGLTELVEYDDFGRPDALKYPMFGVALIPSIRALRDRITELERLTNG